MSLKSVCLIEVNNAVTSPDLKTTLETVASEDKPRSSMTTIIGVGVGVAAAAFFVKPSPPLPSASFLLTSMRRGELV